MKQLAPPRVDWHVYLEREVVTADNHRLGVVSDVFRDDLTGVLFIRIRNGATFEGTIDLPASAIGVISRQRLRLDVDSNQLNVPGMRKLEPVR